MVCRIFLAFWIFDSNWPFCIVSSLCKRADFQNRFQLLQQPIKHSSAPMESPLSGRKNKAHRKNNLWWSLTSNAFWKYNIYSDWSGLTDFLRRDKLFSKELNDEYCVCFALYSKPYSMKRNSFTCYEGFTSVYTKTITHCYKCENAKCGRVILGFDFHQLIFYSNAE